MPRRRILFAALLATLPGLARPAPAHADDYALIVGVQSYKNETGFTALHYTEDDARELKNTLERVGFQVKLLSTAADSPALPNKENIKTAVENVCSNADADSTLIVFLAGHGDACALHLAHHLVGTELLITLGVEDRLGVALGELLVRRLAGHDVAVGAGRLLPAVLLRLVLLLLAGVVRGLGG